VEHACHQCGAAVEDGTPFCRHCGAPQIRVATALQVSDSTLAEAGREPQAPQPVRLGAFNQIDWRRGYRAAVLAAGVGGLAGILVAVASGVPQAAFLVWMLGSGMVAVVAYRRRHLGRVTAGMGARLGAAAGAAGFAMFALLSAMQVLVLRGGGQLQSMLETQLKQTAERSGDANAQQLIQQFLTPQGLMLLIAMGMVLMLVSFLLLSSVGGAIAATLWGEKRLHS
jgi:hypothetical protein